MNQTCVALDLETTGLEPKIDEIIEIGAVKFRGDEVIDTFNSLINPRRTVPYRIHLMCGIEQSQLDSSPVFEELAEHLNSFIDGCPIVGHNVSFDLGFLAQKGIMPANAIYDTWELATILLFQQPDYSLSSLAKKLGLSPPQHRALPDAMAAKELLLALFERSLQLDITTIEELIRLSETADWETGRFFREVLKLKAKTAFSPGGGTLTPEGKKEVSLWEKDAGPTLTARAERASLDIEKLSAILEPDGILAQALSGYEHRPGQVHMMQAVAQALNNNEHLIVEAGTGTGKSIAYLLPSTFFAMENSVHLVISTNTINLQEQLIGKDIPDLLRALALGQAPSIKNLRVIQLKGRANYLCLKKYEAMRASSRLSIDEAKLLARITVWLQSTQTGDRAELNLSGSETAAWNKLCAEFDERFGMQCPHRQRDTCFLYRARFAAENAHLIVVNHALLLSVMTPETGVLPHYDHLIIDEAHHLEDEATDQLSSKITQWDLFNYLNQFRNEPGGGLSTGLLHWLDESLRGSTAALSRKRQLKQLGESLDSHIDKAQLHLTTFLDRIRDFVEKQTPDQGDYDRNLLLTWDKRTQPGWSRVETSWEDLNLVLRDIADDLDRVYIALDELEDSTISGYEHLILELSYLFSRSNELRQQIDSLVSQPESDSIYWLSINSQNDSVELSIAPLRVGRVLRDSLFSSKDCVILTGATLSTENHFEYIKDRLGLENINEVLLGTPFDYPGSTMIYLPADIPDPGDARYQQALSDMLTELCRTCRGHTLVLFTSHAALRATQAAIQAPLEQEGILVMGQGVDGSPKQLIAAFKANPESVLLGTASLWEGIDVVGDVLSVLVITRLPFNVPTEPIFAARCKLFDDPFNEYGLPQAAIRFKQGFGRLIRSKDDRGALIIFDKRLQTKRYGPVFLDSIPPCTIVRGSSKELPSAVVKWLEREHN
ncbi:MAG TPA: DEAD/DEAH box helicase family protein [Dehalococcoidia bacterium]|nr:DEAD/DEAH box helicase family protein [Dehalococcoidia bacterium]